MRQNGEYVAPHEVMFKLRPYEVTPRLQVVIRKKPVKALTGHSLLFLIFRSFKVR